MLKDLIPLEFFAYVHHIIGSPVETVEELGKEKSFEPLFVDGHKAYLDKKTELSKDNLIKAENKLAKYTQELDFCPVYFENKSL